MSDFTFNCPSCKQPVLVDEQLAGTKIKCPVCNNDAIIPSPPGRASKLGVATLGQEKAAAPPIPMAARAAMMQKSHGLPGWAKALIGAVVVGGIGAVLVFTDVIDRVKGWINKDSAAELAAAQAAQAAPPPKPAPKPKPAPPQDPVFPPEWSLDIIGARIPGAKVSGTIESDGFRLDGAFLSNGLLMLRQGTGTFADKEVVVYLGKPGENLEGRTWEINADHTVGVPQVVKKWKPDPRYAARSVSYTKGYVMKLVLGKATNGRIPGKIYVSFPDEAQSVVAGTFEALSPAAAAAAADQQAQQQQQQAQQPARPQIDQKMRDRYGL